MIFVTALLLLSLHQLRREEAWLQDVQGELTTFLETYYREVCPHLPNTTAQHSPDWLFLRRQWQDYRQQGITEVPRWYRRLARHSHPDAAGQEAQPLLFAEATDAYRKRDWQQLRELCTAASLPPEWTEQLTEQALQSLRQVRRLTERLKETAEYRLWQRHHLAKAQGFSLASLVIERLQTEVSPA